MGHEKLLIEKLLSTCNDIDERWNEHLDFWEGDKPGYFNEIAEFSHYVVDQYKIGQTGDFSAIFEVIERAIIQGNEKVRSLAIVGFLEGVQNISSHTEFGPNVFDKWLGSQSKFAWAELNELWSDKSSLEEVIKSQK